MKKLILFLLLIFIISCASEKTKTIDTFYVIYNDILNLKIEKINDHLNKNSKAFVNEFTSASDFSAETISSIGKKYHLADFAVNYVFKYQKELEKNNTDSIFYLYLGLDQVPLFDFIDLYTCNEKRTRVTPDVLISLEKDKVLNWLKLDREEDGLKLDLVFLLQQHSKMTNIIFSNQVKNNGLKDKDELYKTLLGFNSSEEFSLDFIIYYVNRRREIIQSSM